MNFKESGNDKYSVSYVITMLQKSHRQLGHACLQVGPTRHNHALLRMFHTKKAIALTPRSNDI